MGVIQPEQSDVNSTLFGDPTAPEGPVVLRPRITPGLLLSERKHYARPVTIKIRIVMDDIAYC